MEKKKLILQEQIFEDLVTGLEIELKIIEKDKHHPFRIRIKGDSLKHGNRELTFSPEGKMNGGGTFISCPHPN